MIIVTRALLLKDEENFLTNEVGTFPRLVTFEAAFSLATRILCLAGMIVKKYRDQQEQGRLIKQQNMLLSSLFSFTKS